MALGSFFLLFLRRPETLTAATFWGDDRIVYQHALEGGLSTLLLPYAGTLITLQRAVVYVETLAPTAGPFTGALAMVLAIAAVAGFLASGRMSRFLPDWRWRTVLAVVFVALPAADGVTGTLADVQWITGAYLLAMLVATFSARWRYADAACLLVAGLTGPLSIVLAPFYVLRAVREPRWGWQATWVTVAAIFQVAVYATALRSPASPDWGVIAGAFGWRLLVVPVLGIYGPTLSVVVVLVALAAAFYRLPIIWLGLAIAVTVAVLGMASMQAPSSWLLDPRLQGRYFYLVGVVVAAGIVLALSRRQWLALPAAMLLLVGILADFRIP